MYSSKSLQGGKSAITILHISIESTLFLFLLIYNLLDPNKYYVFIV